MKNAIVGYQLYSVYRCVGDWKGFHKDVQSVKWQQGGGMRAFYLVFSFIRFDCLFWFDYIQWDILVISSSRSTSWSKYLNASSLFEQWSRKYWQETRTWAREGKKANIEGIIKQATTESNWSLIFLANCESKYRTNIPALPLP